MKPKQDYSQALAVVHNELARSRNDLTAIGLRLVLMLALRAHEDGDFLTHRLRVTEYQRELGLQGKSAYEHLKQVAKELLKTIVETKNPVEESQTMFQVLSRAKYWNRLGEVELRFHEEMRPLLLELKERFTTIPAEYFFRLRSVYAMKFYMVCRSWNPQTNRLPQWSMTVKELRRWLDLGEDEYTEVKNIRVGVLERAKHELDAVADVTFRYEAVLEGKGRHARVVAWNFVAVGNTPKVTLPAGARARKARINRAAAAKQTVQEAESARRLVELERIWLAAGPADRARWVRQMDLTPPSSGQRPSPLFLFAFEAVLQRDQQAELPFDAQSGPATENQ